MTPLRSFHLALLPAALSAGFVIAGCGLGGDSGSGDRSPSALAPATSGFYAEVAIDPSISQDQAISSIVSRLGGPSETSSVIDAAIQQALDGSDVGLDYDADIKPWLGDRAGLFVAALTPEGGDIAGVIATTDGDAAQDALDKAHPESEQREYGDASYSYDGTAQVAAGIVDGFLVVGTEDGFKSAVDTVEADSLEDSDKFSTAVDALPDDRLAAFYTDSAQLFDAALAASGTTGPEALIAGQVSGLFGDEAATASVLADEDGVVLESTGSSIPGLAMPVATDSGLLASLPADSWLAFGVSDVGTTLNSLVDLASNAGIPGVSAATVETIVKSQTGLDLHADLIDWIGDIAFFVHGTDLASLSGGVVIETSDADSSGRALDALRTLIEQDGSAKIDAPSIDGVEGFEVSDPSLDQPIAFLQTDKRVTIAYGSGAAAEALSEGEELGADSAFGDAAARLGDDFQPSIYVAVPSILELAENFGATSDPDYVMAKPYLDHFADLIGGARTDGDQNLSRLRFDVR